MNNLKHYTLAALAVALFAGPAHADVVGYSSDFNKVEVGASNVKRGPHVKGRPGIGLINNKRLPRGIVDFKGLTAYARPDSHGVSSLTYPSSAPTNHSTMGVFRFAKVSGADVYFGEWSQTGDVTDGTHTVYYVGDTSGTTVPTSGTASYAVKGISNYDTNSVLNGTFNASFNGTRGTLTGNLISSDPYSDFSLNIGTADISGAGFSGDGAYANTDKDGSYYNLNVRGRFFGASAKALAGMVTFPDSSKEYNTAFGGAKK